MANTYVDYTATASQTDFAFNFDYLEDEHVTVEINGVATTDFTIVTSPALKVVLDSGATAGDIVRVRRKSQPDTNLVDFENGSVLTESELDRAYLHNRYLAEEIAELNDASMQVEQGGTNWDAKGLRIKNVGDPTDTADASNKLYVDNKVNQLVYGGDAPLKWQFTGTAGANTTYTVTGAEINGDTTYDVSINGLVQEPGVDFTVDPDTDTLTIIPTLGGGEDIVIIQRGFGVPVTGTVPGSSIVNGAITTEKLADGAVTTAKIDADAVDGSKIADDSIDSEHYVDGSIDSVHLAADVIDGTKIADDSIDSEHYVDGSIDEAHIADEAITSDKISTTDSVFNVQTNGNVCIGTSTPDGLLTVVEDSATDDIIARFVHTGNPSLGAGNGVVRVVRINSRPGNYPSSDITYLDLAVDADNNKVGFGAGNAAASLPAGQSDLSRCHLILDPLGKVGISNINPAYELDVLGDINASGEVRNSGVILTSDDRVKHNEEVITNALATLAKLTPKKYIKTTEMYEADHNFELDAEGRPVDEEVEYKVEAGVIAQDVLQVEELAFAVTPETTNENGEVIGPHGVNYNSLFTYAVAAIKEQQAIIEDLKARVEALEA